MSRIKSILLFGKRLNANLQHVLGQHLGDARAVHLGAAGVGVGRGHQVVHLNSLDTGEPALAVENRLNVLEFLSRGCVVVLHPETANVDQLRGN